MIKESRYLAVVTGAPIFQEIEHGKVKKKINIGSEENFVLRAKSTEEALTQARKVIYGKGIKERRFKGVVRLN